jgi:hypothetical protein
MGVGPSALGEQIVGLAVQSKWEEVQKQLEENQSLLSAQDSQV